jgi:hypothetical protein
MPIGPAHKLKHSKNLFALAVLIAVVGGLYYLAILKMSGH